MSSMKSDTVNRDPEVQGAAAGEKMSNQFYIKRVNTSNIELFLTPSGEWLVGRFVGPGVRQVKTWKTERGAFLNADRFARCFPTSRVVVMTDVGEHGTHEVTR